MVHGQITDRRKEELTLDVGNILFLNRVKILSVFKMNKQKVKLKQSQINS